MTDVTEASGRYGFSQPGTQLTVVEARVQSIPHKQQPGAAVEERRLPSRLG